MEKIITEATREKNARQQLKEMGYTLEKRVNTTNPYHSGCYRIINSYTGSIETDPDYNMTLEDVEAFIAE